MHENDDEQHLDFWQNSHTQTHAWRAAESHVFHASQRSRGAAYSYDRKMPAPLVAIDLDDNRIAGITVNGHLWLDTG